MNADTIKANVAALTLPERSELLKRLTAAYETTFLAYRRADKACGRGTLSEAEYARAEAAYRAADFEFTATLDACEELSPSHPDPFISGLDVV